MPDKLKPCPFCGGLAEIETFANPKTMVSVKCQNCPAEIGGWHFCNGDKNVNIAAVTTAWNRRVGEEATNECTIKN